MSAVRHRTEQAPLHLISNGWDIFFAGGLSVAVYLLMAVSFRPVPPDVTVAMFVFNLSFLINFPHFLASYQLLYGDFRQKILRDWRYFSAAVLVPIVLGCGLLSAFVFSNAAILGYFLNAMYFFVGWHYVKQTFGVVVVSNALRGTFYTPVEKRWLQINMYALWGVSVAAMNQGFQVFAQMDVRYYSLNFPPWTLWITYTALAISGIGVVVCHLRKYVREGRLPCATAVISLGAIYVWLLPLLTHAMYAHMIPAFHSLQYLIFVYAYKSHQTESMIAKPESPEGRRQWLAGVGGFFFGSVLLGALSFYLVPSLIDQFGLVDKAMFGSGPAMLVATIFLNIHHYFIDNVIWRSQNPEMRRHLFRLPEDARRADPMVVKPAIAG